MPEESCTADINNTEKSHTKIYIYFVHTRAQQKDWAWEREWERRANEGAEWKMHYEKFILLSKQNIYIHKSGRYKKKYSNNEKRLNGLK